MRTIDLDLVRNKIGEFILDGKVYSVYEATLGQTIQHRSEAASISKKLEKLRKDENFEEFTKLQLEWLMREIQIFIPEMKDEALKKLTPGQRSKVMNLIFGVEEDESSRKDSSDSKKKKKRASRGGK